MHLCWKVQQYIEELQREEWLNRPEMGGWMDQGKYGMKHDKMCKSIMITICAFESWHLAILFSILDCWIG